MNTRPSSTRTCGTRPRLSWRRTAAGRITSAGYALRTLRLSLLAPDIHEAILNSTQPEYLTMADFTVPYPRLSARQQEQFGF